MKLAIQGREGAFLKGIVEEGRGNSSKGNASSNAMTILKLSGKVLPKDLPE